MRVLFVIDSLSGGGAEKLISDMLPFEDDEIECFVLAINEENDKYSKKLLSKGVMVDFMPNGIKPIGIIKYIIKYSEEQSIDVIHANLFPTIYYCAIAKKILGKFSPKLIMTEHSTDNKRRHKKALRNIERFIYSEYEKVICISDAVRDELMKWLGTKENEKYMVINNGINVKDYSLASPYERTQLIKNISKADILLCMVGSIKPLKNHKLMIEILKRLPPYYKLLIVGEGPSKDEILKMVQSYDLTDRVMFFGFRNDVEKILATSDVVVIPSKWEGFGLSAVEAMACGKPVVVSNIPGLSGVVGDGGLSATSIEEFVNAILLLEDKDYYERISKKAESRAEKFDITKTREHYEYVIKDVFTN